MTRFLMTLPANESVDLSGQTDALCEKLRAQGQTVHHVELGKLDALKQDCVALILHQVVDYFSDAGYLAEANDVVVIEGLLNKEGQPFYHCYLNEIIAKAFLAQIIVVADQTEAVAPLANIYRDHLGLKVLGTPEEAVQLLQTMAIEEVPLMTPPVFLSRLVELARRANCRIALPEGAEPRTIQAAMICHKRGIARPILLGDREEIMAACQSLHIELPDAIEVIEPATIAEKYIEPMYELRKHKGMTKEQAKELLLHQPIMLGTMMLQQGDVQGLVSGAIHTTADTIRPALQLIKTKADCSQITSSFLMCLATGVVLYADCAVVPNPDADALAEVAIQTAETARSFGLEPRVGFLSYSTGKSGSGPDVDIVRAAVEKVKQLRPDLLVEGPLQYDAAADAGVAALKMPDSPVAGKVNVFIFPDLSAGNIAYKAVQRTNNILSIGPVMQGIRKPVNDLSRGATVQDIVYTIAVTAAQA